MKKRGKDLIISSIIALLIGAFTLPVKTINGAVISNNFSDVIFSSLSGWFLFLTITFISVFFVLNIASRDLDPLQKRLEEMEGISSSTNSIRKPSAWIGRAKYLMGKKRYVEQIPQNNGKYATDMNYSQDSKQILSNYGDSRLVEYFIKTNGEMPRDDADMAAKYFQDFKDYSSLFNKELERFPVADHGKVLDSLKGKKEKGLTPLNLQKSYPIHKPDETVSVDPNFYEEFKIEAPKDVADPIIAVRLGRGLPYTKSIRTPANDIRVGRYPYERKRGKGGHSSYETLQDIENGREMNPRQAVHVTLNGLYSGKHRAYDWAADKVDHILLAPAKELIDNKDLLYLDKHDSASFGDLPIPSGSEIVISKEQYKLMSPKEIKRLKRRTGAEIVTIQSPDDKNVLDTAKRRIQERGYSLSGVHMDRAEEESNLYNAIKYLGNISPVHLGDAEYFSPNQLAAELSRIPWLQYRIDSLRVGRPISTDTDVGELKRELRSVKKNMGGYFDRAIDDIDKTRRGNPTHKDIISLERIIEYADNHHFPEVVSDKARKYIREQKQYLDRDRRDMVA